MNKTDVSAKVDRHWGRARVIFMERKKPFYILQSDRLPRLKGDDLNVFHRRLNMVKNLRSEAVHYARKVGKESLEKSIISSFVEMFDV